MPKVSVIIPVFNRTDQLKQAVDSVLAQTLEDFELIIIDDGSTQDVTKFIPLDQLHRIKYLRKKHGGVSSARNAGIKIAQGRLIAFLDSDDVWLPQKLEKQLAFMHQNPELLLSQCEEIWIRQGKRVNPMDKHQKRSGDIFVPSLELCLISPSAVILKKELFAQVGLFDESLPACEDYDLWLRVTRLYPVGLLPEKLMTRYAGHPDQLSAKYWGLDRFRIKSLRKILKTELSPEQRTAAIKTLRAKCRIVAQGALKRGNLLGWLYYGFILRK